MSMLTQLPTHLAEPVCCMNKINVLKTYSGTQTSFAIWLCALDQESTMRFVW